MTNLLEGQFEIDGVPFGLDLPVFVTDDGFNPGRAELIATRVKIGGGDGIRPGVDYFGGATWSFKLATDGTDAASALELYRSIASVWPRDEIRLEPGAAVKLRYRLGGRTRAIYGRGGRFTPATPNTMWGGLMSAAADFDTFDHLHYDDAIQSVTIPIAPVTSPSNGVIPPFIVPFTSTGINPTNSRVAHVYGDRPTPVWLVFEGPILNPLLTCSAGWTARIDDVIYEGDPVTVDAHPWVRSAVRQSGGGVQINPRATSIRKLYLPPGDHTFTFTGTDPTGTARVTVNWQNANSTL